MELKDMTDAEKRKRIEELKKQVVKVKAEHDFYKAMQLALKLVLNGSYGAFCHPAFSVSNANIANSITALSREVINFMLDHIEDYFYHHWHLDQPIHANLGSNYITLGPDGKNYYHRPDGKLVDKRGRKDELDKSGRLVTGVEQIFTAYHLEASDLVPSDKLTLEYQGQSYQILHKIYIWDFSEVQALSQEYLILPDPKSTVWDETRGVLKEPIIIYGDTDSLYLSFTTIAKTVGYDMSNYDAGLKFILHINGNFVKFFFQDLLEEYAKPYGVKNIHDFELETINKSGLHLQKKMYINNVVWEDGVFYEDLSHFYPKGVDIVRSSTPLFVRENIWDFINYLFKDPDHVNIRDILKNMKELKRQFKLANLEDISMTTSLSNYEAKVMDDQNAIECVKGCHFSVKAAAFHNYMLNKNSTFKTKYDLLKGGKIKYYFCQHPANDRFAYLRSFHPNEICEKENIAIDYDEQFDKTMLSIVNRFLEPIGLPPINKRLSVLNSLFAVKTEAPKEFPNLKPRELELPAEDGYDPFWSL